MAGCSSILSGNITLDCENPIVGGYNGEAIIVDYAYNPVITYDAANPRKIKSITCPQGGVHVVENAFVTPFNGSTTAGNTDNGLNEFLKTVSFQIPERGADVSRDKVEPFFNSTFGYLMVLPKKDRVGDGSFEVVGAKSPLYGDISTLTRDENANGGMWGLSLTCREQYAEVALTGDGSTYESAKAAYDNLKTQVQVGAVTLKMSAKKKNKVFVNVVEGFDSLYIVEDDGDGTIRRRTVTLSDADKTEDPDGEVGWYVAIEGQTVTLCGAILYINISSDIYVEAYDGIDVSKNTALGYLNCYGNQLTTLDVSKNTALDSLDCNSNQLTTLDVSKNTALTTLYCSSNQLTTLDVSKNTALDSLNCSSNQLTTLDVSKNTALTYLDCGSNTTVTMLAVAKTYKQATVSTNLASLITDATSTSGTLNIYGGDNTTVHEAATAKGWTVNLK